MDLEISEERLMQKDKPKQVDEPKQEDEPKLARTLSSSAGESVKLSFTDLDYKVSVKTSRK